MSLRLKLGEPKIFITSLHSGERDGSDMKVILQVPHPGFAKTLTRLTTQALSP